MKKYLETSVWLLVFVLRNTANTGAVVNGEVLQYFDKRSNPIEVSPTTILKPTKLHKHIVRTDLVAEISHGHSSVGLRAQ